MIHRGNRGFGFAMRGVKGELNRSTALKALVHRIYTDMCCICITHLFPLPPLSASRSLKFTPSPQVPALQYVGSVDIGGAAEMAGLNYGDFIIEVLIM